jgi:SAM-dependent methyltransferase
MRLLLAKVARRSNGVNPAKARPHLDMAKGHPVLTELQARLVTELHLTPGSRVLDAGCGPGTQAREIARAAPGTSVVGVDVSRLMVAEALRRARGSGLDVTFQIADAAALPFADGDFSARRRPCSSTSPTRPA